MSSKPWRVNVAAALEAWERRDHPSPERVVALMEWLFRWAENGPPGPDDGALPVPLEDEPLFSYRVPEVDVVVTYYVVVYELLMLVKEIEDA